VSHDDLIEEQRAFYVADAVGYDGFLRSLEDADNEEPLATSFRAGREGVTRFLAEHAPLGTVLDIAAGNGILSELVFRAGAERVVLLDATETSLGFAAERLAGFDHELEAGDVFTWDAGGRRFDTIVFSSWLHHVPRHDLPRFWAIIDGLLADDGQVLFDFPSDESAATATADEAPTEPSDEYSIYTPADGVSIRDHRGQRWRVVHALWSRDELVAALDELGWRTTASAPGWWQHFEWLRVERR
jgi:SAM-dependent methyltransferase